MVVAAGKAASTKQRGAVSAERRGPLLLATVQRPSARGRVCTSGDAWWMSEPGVWTASTGVSIASGLGVQLATFFWNHPVSFFLFLVPGVGLVSAGMLLYLWSVVTGGE